MADVKNVSVGKPKIGGAVYRALVGATLPTDATSALGTDFKQLGYISEDGLTNSNSPESDTVKAWGGDTVLMLETGKTDTFQFSLMEVTNTEVLKAVYGDDNVTGDIENGITIKANSTEQTEHSYVIEMVLREGAVKRVVIPSAKLTELGDITYTDSDAILYEMTLTAMPDEDGNTHYEYIQSR